MPPNLVRPTVRKFRDFSSEVLIYEYYGDERRKATQGAKMVDGRFTQDHPLLDGSARNGQIIVVSSHDTWAKRHGPGKLEGWRKEDQHLSDIATRAALHVPDYRCPHLLKGKFDTVWVDEAHEIKRRDSQGSLAVQWLHANFVGLATATPAHNRIDDWRGYLIFCQPRNAPTDARLSAWHAKNPHFNPYEVERDATSAILGMFNTWADKYIFKAEDAALAGVYLGKVMQFFVVRRTYSTEIDGSTIGSRIPGLVRRYTDVQFSLEHQEMYKAHAKYPLRKLMTVLPNGKISWNMRHFRSLVLNSTWVYFEYIKDQVYANDLDRWKRSDNILHEWLTAILEITPGLFTLPKEEDHLGQIRIVLDSAPKLRHMLAIIAEVVIKHQRKAAVWSLFPAEQLLVWDILRKLEFSPELYSSDLDQQAKDDMIYRFNNDQHTSKVFVTSYGQSSYGLDLQELCTDTISLDIPLSRAVRAQAEHRFRRIGAKRDVISWNLSVKYTFNDRQTLNKLRKAIPNTAAELNSRIFDIKTGAEPDQEFSLGQWVSWNGKIMHPDDSRIVLGPGDTAPELLSPEDVMMALLEEEEGNVFEVDINAE